MIFCQFFTIFFSGFCQFFTNFFGFCRSFVPVLNFIIYYDKQTRLAEKRHRDKLKKDKKEITLNTKKKQNKKN